MPFRNDEFLRKAKVTVYYNPDTKQFLDYVKVQPYDSASGYTTNTEYIAPWHFMVAGVNTTLEPVEQVVIENKSGEEAGQNVHKYVQGV